jgi:hypothetical protein
MLAEIGKDNILKYLKALAAVGVVECIRDRDSGRSMGHKLWRLVRDLGPVRPLTWKDGRVFDPNTNTVIERPTNEQQGRIALARRTAAGL